MLLQQRMEGRRIVETAEKNVEGGEIEEDKTEILNGRKGLFKLEGSPKQSKVERK